MARRLWIGWFIAATLALAHTALASGWYSPGQLIPYGQSPAYYPNYPSYPAYPTASPTVMQPPTMVLNLPNPTYYYALPSGVVLNPTPAVAVPYPVYYEDPYSQETAASPPPAANKAAAPAKGNFAVLAGSFLEENLAQLSERYIQSLGYPSYRQKITVKDKQFTRIYAGPFPKKKEASDASKEMQAKYNMPGVVVPFRP